MNTKMHSRPVIDVLLEAILNGDSDALAEIQEHRAAESVDVRALMCTSEEAGVDLDLELGLRNCEYVTPIFEGPRALFISRHTSLQARLTGGASGVLLDYSIAFDSNFAEKLRAILNGEAVQAADHDRIVTVLKLRANNPRVQFDAIPFLLENVRLVREDDNNQRPLNTLVAFRMLDHLDWDAFRADSTRFVFREDKTALRGLLLPKQEQFLQELYSEEVVLRQEARALGIRALLLRFATLWHAHKRERNRLWSELIEFCIFELGALPLTELSLIWSGIAGKEPARFFGPIIGRSKTMLAHASGMAWDMTHLRILEQMATQSSLGSFFIPYFVSLDARWRDLLRLNPIRVMLVDDRTKSVLFGRASEREFQLMLGDSMTDRAKLEMTPEKVAGRRQSAKMANINAMGKLVEDEERRWR